MVNDERKVSNNVCEKEREREHKSIFFAEEKYCLFSSCWQTTTRRDPPAREQPRQS